MVLKAVCFIALRLDDEPLSEMSVVLEGTAKYLPCFAILLFLSLISLIILVVCNNVFTFSKKVNFI